MENNHVTVLEIDGNAIKHNLAFFKKQIKPETKVLVVIKAFGYGSDAVGIAKFIENEVDYFAVAYTHEGVVLREAGIELPILVLHPQTQNIPQLVCHKLEPSLYNFKILEAFLTYADETLLMNYPIHLKFNTGLNRIGFWHEDVPNLLAIIKGSKHCKIESLFSHLAASEDATEADFSVKQINMFAYVVQQFYKHLGYEPFIHILNTSGAIHYQKAQFDMIRIGIGLFGFGNTPEITQHLKNVCTLKSIISQIHLIGPGETVGYNRAFVAKDPTKTATIPIGHADGISRMLGNENGYILINDQKAPIIGNVCMDMIMVDVTKIECNEGDEVTLFNSQEMINSMADKTETISYEVLTSISQRVQRKFIS